MASWSRQPRHKGKITMRGRIMAGSQAVISHDETGQAVFVAYYPPDLHLSQAIVASCEQGAAATGSDVFVIDRAVNAQALAQAFDQSGFIGKYLSRLRKLDHVIAPKEGFEAQLQASRLSITCGMRALGMTRQIGDGLPQRGIEPRLVSALQGPDNGT